MPPVLPLLSRELQHRLALRLAVEWLALIWLLHGVSMATGEVMSWNRILLAVVVTPCVACLLAPLLIRCRSRLNLWLATARLHLEKGSIPTGTRVYQALWLTLEWLLLALLCQIFRAL